MYVFYDLSSQGITKRLRFYQLLLYLNNLDATTNEKQKIEINKHALNHYAKININML